MFFTQDDYRRIEEWLRARAIKDTQFPEADPLMGLERLPIVQDDRNKSVDLISFIRQLSLMGLSDFVNVTQFSEREKLSLVEAINLIPTKQRKLGLTITFNNENGNWVIYQFNGTSLNQWSSMSYWRNITEEAIAEFVYHPDEEDITGVREGSRIYLKLKDRNYDPNNFISKGEVILRRNPVGTEQCSIDDKDHYINKLTHDMVSTENVIYVIRYNYDLDGEPLMIPKGCVLWFRGGTINNGSIYMDETPILGVTNIDDIGTAKLLGTPARGQVMGFPIEVNTRVGGVGGVDGPDAPVLAGNTILKWYDGSAWKSLIDEDGMSVLDLKLKALDSRVKILEQKGS